MYNLQITHSRIKELSKVRKISIGEINKFAGSGENAISQLAKSQDGMKTRNLYETAQCLNCSVDYLLGRTESSQSHLSGSAVLVGDVSQNGGAIGIGNTVTNAAAPRSEQEAALINIFNSLELVKQAKLLVYADSLKGE